MSDARLQTIQRGHLSGIALEHFGQELREQQKLLLSRIMVDYRAGMVDNNKLVGFLASYTALEDLYLTLQRSVNSANKAQKEVISND